MAFPCSISLPKSMSCSQIVPPIKTLVIGQLQQPRAGSTLFRIKRSTPFVKRQEDLMNEILCLGGISYYPGTDRINCPGITPVEKTKRGYVIFLEPKYQSLIADLGFRNSDIFAARFKPVTGGTRNLFVRAVAVTLRKNPRKITGSGGTHAAS